MKVKFVNKLVQTKSFVTLSHCNNESEHHRVKVKQANNENIENTVKTQKTQGKTEMECFRD